MYAPCSCCFCLEQRHCLLHLANTGYLNRAALHVDAVPDTGRGFHLKVRALLCNLLDSTVLLVVLCVLYLKVRALLCNLLDASGRYQAYIGS